MNNKTNTFAVYTDTPAVSEVVQRTAFAYGYKWTISGQNIAHVNALYIIFNPTFKDMGWESTRESAEKAACEVVTCLDRMVELFQNPPCDLTTVGDVVIRKNGNVSFPDINVEKSVFDKVVEVRNEFLGVEKPVRKLPVVRFNYLSKRNGWGWRNVAVLVSNEDYIEGLDLDDGNAYKRFLNKSMGSDMKFVELREVPE